MRRIQRTVGAALLFLAMLFCEPLGAQTWSKTFSGYYIWNIYHMPGTNASFAITMDSGGILKSTDGGATWAFRNTGLDGIHSSWTPRRLAADTSGNLLLLGSNANVFRSTDQGETWTRTAATGLPVEWVNTLIFDSYTNAFFAATSSTYIWKTTDLGETWTYMGGDSSTYSLYSGPADGTGTTGMLLAGTYYRSIIRSLDGGATWDNTGGGVYWLTDISAGPNGWLFAISDAVLLRSKDYGLMWERRVENPAQGGGGIFDYLAWAPGAGTIYASTATQTLLASADGGDTWVPVSIGAGATETTSAVEMLPDGTVLAGTNTGIYRYGTAVEPPPAPEQPVNQSPADGAVDVSLTPTLSASAFALPEPTGVRPGARPEPAPVHEASRWQIRTIDGSYHDPVFDYTYGLVEEAPSRAILAADGLTSVDVPDGVLAQGTEYAWRVRYMASNDEWSEWSEETTFTTESSAAPARPVNESPADGAVLVSLTPTLSASAFAVDEPAAVRSGVRRAPEVSHAASRWQIRRDDGSYDEPVFDYTYGGVPAVSSRIAPAADGLTSVDVPDGVLERATRYAWRVRYMASNDEWSDWSEETSFITGLGVATVDGGGSGIDCFIATAAFGSPQEAHVMILRRFRDRFLVASPAGRAFVRFYYRTSPAAAAWIARRDWARAAVRTALLPVYGCAWLLLNGMGWLPLALLAIAAIAAKRAPRAE